jgi:hypothetical protein
MDKNLENRLFAEIETLYTENLALKTMLDQCSPDWKRVLDRLLANPSPEFVAALRVELRLLRFALQHAEIPEQASLEIPPVAPAKKEMN